MPTLEDVRKRTPYAHILGYGPSGSGKTHFISTVPGKKYVMNFEQDNIVTLATIKDSGTTTFDDIKSYDDLLEKMLALSKVNPYDFIALDGGRAIYQLIMDGIIKGTGREMPQIQDYGLAGDRFKKVLRQFNTLKCDTYVTFHEQIEKDELLGRTLGRLLIPGKFLPDEIPPLYNLCFHFVNKPSKDDKPVRRIHTAPTPMFPTAGDKFNALDMEEEADFSIIKAKIEARLATF